VATISPFPSGWEGTGVLDSSKWTSEVGSGGLTVATDQFLENTHSLKYTSASGPSHYITKTITGIATIGARVAFRINTVVGTEKQHLVLRQAAGGNLIYLQSTSTQINCYDAIGSQYVGSSFTFTADTWYQAEVFYGSTPAGIKWKVWNAAGTSLVHAEQTLAISTTTCDTIFLGMYGAPGGSNTYWLDIFTADDAAYPGPYQAPTGITINYLRV
jgi:hypothetical protein